MLDHLLIANVLYVHMLETPLSVDRYDCGTVDGRTTKCEVDQIYARRENFSETLKGLQHPRTESECAIPVADHISPFTLVSHFMILATCLCKASPKWQRSLSSTPSEVQTAERERERNPMRPFGQSDL